MLVFGGCDAYLPPKIGLARYAFVQSSAFMLLFRGQMLEAKGRGQAHDRAWFEASRKRRDRRSSALMFGGLQDGFA